MNILPAYSNPEATFILTSKGKKIEAKPSHQMVLEKLFMEKEGLNNRKELKELLKATSYDDYFNFLLKETKCVALWEIGYKGTPNKTQQKVIDELIEKGFELKQL